MKKEERYIWEPEDIIPGLYIVKQPKGGTHLDFTRSYPRTITFKISYDNHILQDEKAKCGHYGLSNCLTDGWYYRVGTKEEIAKKLTEDNYRLLTKDEYLTMINNTTQGFNQ